MNDGTGNRHRVTTPAGVRLSFPLSQSELASLIGASRESVNKVLGRLRRQGLISVEHNYILLRDPDALRAVGE